MSAGSQDSLSGPELERQALGALRKMRERLAAIESARQEPLAIVGAACRLPGAADIEQFWDLLCRGGDAITDVPPDRWDDAALARAGAAADARVPRRAGLLPRVDCFDAEFFGISAREARFMDPQQRLFLECTWQALESAGIPPLGLRGSRTGVFVGTTTSDYLHLLLQRLSGAQLDAYMVAGNTLNATAGRVSYTLGLQGPAMAIDTACSSSLVAIDRACRSVRDGESRLAIAGGVNLALTLEFMLSLARWGMLAPDGRCKTFDAAANGFVRAEGCGVVLIKRLSDALVDGDRIWALVRGWAVNQAGMSSGFAVPNGLAQAEVLREALAAARVAPASVGYVEAHGTGTSLGDPIEMEAIAAVYGAQRKADQALWVGAVKSNVGHLESAAGVTGLIKTVLALRHRQIPPNVHFHDPSPHIPWERIAVRIPVRLQDWPAIDGRRLAGVSAFGFSGTNAHIVLEEAPPLQVAPDAEEALPALLLTLSARNPQSLQELALRYADRIDPPASGDLVAADLLCRAASTARSHLSHRLAASARDREALAMRLRAAARGESGTGIARGSVGSDRPRVAFLFTGQGSQYAGMGRGLARSSGVFRDALQRCAAIIDPLLDRSLIELIFGAGDDATLLDRTGCTQPALFAIEYALVEWWRSMGVHPALVLGHSVGEFAAACCAGVLTLQDAATLVALRGALMQSLPAGGAMAVVFAAEEVVRAHIAAGPGVLAVAGINGPEETVVAGEAAALHALSATFLAANVRVESLAVSHAFHSPLMQPILAQFEAAAQRSVSSPPQMSVISSMTGRLAAADWGTPAYWLQQLQAPVRWFDALRTAALDGLNVAVEIGPQPVLAGLGRRALPAAPIVWLSSLRRGQDDAASIMQTLGTLYVHGAVDDWAGRAGAAARAQVPLPSYPFQAVRHWVDAPCGSAAASAAQWCHPLLGAAVPLANGNLVFQTAAGDARHDWIREHRFHDISVWPAAASVEMMLAAAREVSGARLVQLHDIEFLRPLVLPEHDHVAIQTSLQPAGAGEWSLQLCRAPPQAGGQWPTIASARVELSSVAATPLSVNMEALQARCRTPVDMPGVHAAMAHVGASFGPAFRALGAVGRGTNEALGQLTCQDNAGDDDWLLNPALLDACMQLVSVAADCLEETTPTLWLPTAISVLTLSGRARGSLWGHARLRAQPGSNQRLVADLSLWNLDGTAVASAVGVQFVRARAADVVGEQSLLRRCAIETVWQRGAPAESAAGVSSTWQIIAGRDTLGESLSEALNERGCRAELLLDATPPSGAPQHIVHLQAVDLPAVLDANVSLQMLQPALESALRVAQACASSQSTTPPRLWIVTRGAQAVHGADSVAPLAATFWGLARVVRAEHPQLNCTVIDIDAGCTGSRLAQTLLASTQRESQLAVRDGETWLARLAPLAVPAEFRFVAPPSGSVDDLEPAAFAGRAPRAGEVRIEVQAAGLNFRDVLSTLGMLDGATESLGGECAGIVSALGPGVIGFSPGDAVFALAIGGLASSVCVPQAFVAHRPARLSIIQAAALPIACLTASYALEDLARLRQGDRVLIHAATGGVGMAALQLARLLGANVFATAGNETKRAQLRALGVTHVFDSRSLAFRDAILECTGGQGVEVVLNALSGEFIAAGLSVLAPGGCFLEMGKRGAWSSDAVAAKFPGLRYRPFDLGAAALRDDALAPRLFAKLIRRLNSSELTPLPVTAYPMREARAAFQTMAQARHIGKLVLWRDLSAPAIACPVRNDASYLVTGGFGALGLVVAEALAARGARHLILLGRRAASASAESTIARLTAQGIVVHRAEVDVGDLTQLQGLLADTGRTMPALCGVIHAAGVLDDAMLAQQSWDRFATVLGPKLQGGLNLALATADAALDFLVLFSAGAAWLGAPGQANYAAANAAVDALALALRAQGRPATAIAWGPWQGPGMAATRAGGFNKRWATLGIGTIAPDAGLAAMFELIERNAAAVSVLPLDWPTYVTCVYGERAPAYFDAMLTRNSGSADAGSNALEQMQAMPAHQRREALLQRLETLVRKMLGLTAERAIEPLVPLRNLGMDSLLSVELRNAIATAFGTTLSATLAFDYPTLDALTDHLMSILRLADPSAAAAAPIADDACVAIAALSQQEAEAQLLTELTNGAQA